MFKSWMWKQRSYREQFEAGEGGSAGGSATVDTGDDAGNDDAGGTQDGDDSGDAHLEDDAEGAGDAGDDEGVTITLGDEAITPAADDEIEGKPAPQWVKELRKRASDLARENRELKQARQAVQQQAPAAVVVGSKPTPEQFEFDSEAYGDALLAWNDRKRQADEQAAKARQEQEASQAAWQQKMSGYLSEKTALKLSDFDDAEAVVASRLSPVQQSIIISGAKSRAALFYVLGKNPDQLQKLAAIKDNVEFAFAAAHLEKELKVTPRKAPPAPERQVRGSAGAATGIDNREAQLEKEADRTGDRSKLIAYRREKRRAAA